jgi:hypothetical protein
VEFFATLGKCRRDLKYSPLPPTHGAAATVFLLLLHLPQDGIFFDLDEILAFLLAKTKPEILYTFPFLGSARAPYLVCLLRSHILHDGTLGLLPRFVRSRGIRGRRRWMMMGVVVWLLLLLLALVVRQRSL